MKTLGMISAIFFFCRSIMANENEKLDAKTYQSFLDPVN